MQLAVHMTTLHHRIYAHRRFKQYVQTVRTQNANMATGCKEMFQVVTNIARSAQHYTDEAR